MLLLDAAMKSTKSTICNTNMFREFYANRNDLAHEKAMYMFYVYVVSAFDRVNHQGILYKLCSVGIGGSVLSILTQFLSNR